MTNPKIPPAMFARKCTTGDPRLLSKEEGPKLELEPVEVFVSFAILLKHGFAIEADHDPVAQQSHFLS